MDDERPLGEARAYLRRGVEDGVRCPCCTQLVKVYRRKLNSGMAVSLIRMYRAAGTDWVHLPTQVGARSREEGKLRYWGLVEEKNAVRDDGGHAGWWRLTDAGRSFVLGESRVPRYARVFDGVCRGLRGELVSISDCLGDKFDYAELMAGQATASADSRVMAAHA